MPLLVSSLSIYTAILALRLRTAPKKSPSPACCNAPKNLYPSPYLPISDKVMAILGTFVSDDFRRVVADVLGRVVTKASGMGFLFAVILIDLCS